MKKEKKRNKNDRSAEEKVVFWRVRSGIPKDLAKKKKEKRDQLTALRVASAISHQKAEHRSDDGKNESRWRHLKPSRRTSELERSEEKQEN